MSKTGKIVLWSVIAVILAALLIWGIAGGFAFRNAWANFMGQFSEIRIGDFVDNMPEDSKQSVQFEKDAAGIKEISLRFVDENIKIVPTDENVIRVEETSTHKIKDEDVMRYGVKNGELVVQSGRNERVFGWWNNYQIDVKVMIPRSFVGSADISTVSGTIDADGLNAETSSFSTTSGDVTLKNGLHSDLRADTVSGRVRVESTIADKLRADTMSGDIRAQGSFIDVNVDSTSGTILIETDRGQAIEANTTSGGITVDCLDASKLGKIHADSVSGSVEIALSNTSGFELSFDTVSGSKSNDFAMKNDTYGDGQTDINVNTTSGSLSMRER